eukprot:CAMPEP_0197524010 /NCGR_PEP_ID=MMETSP1318-20131121/8801_1 /TAXON_ID=552666 /ORGANISM="Partenskyella glossopodia, Strain RCC365" /LENGTH=130 /DNA_ID=CAMNT_0043076853 /DNA_START=88 /DNA_END=477 /DNA_ORIENTATION=+
MPHSQETGEAQPNPDAAAATPKPNPDPAPAPAPAAAPAPTPGPAPQMGAMPGVPMQPIYTTAPPVVIQQQPPVRQKTRCPHCRTYVYTPYGYTGKMQCGNCGRQFDVLPVANVVIARSEIRDEKKIKGEW